MNRPGHVRACHERWDGSGYPDGRTGEEIPPKARIIFACDAFHAMTTDRPYRLRLTVEEALRRLEAAPARSSTRGWSRSACACSRRHPRSRSVGAPAPGARHRSRPTETRLDTTRPGV